LWRVDPANLHGHGAVIRRHLLAQIGASDCEKIGDGLLAQPFNTWTSFAYVVVGVLVMFQAIRSPGGRRWGPIVFGTTLIFVGLGSVAFHGTMPVWAKTAHDLPIAAAALFVMLYDLAVIWPRLRMASIVLFFAITVALWPVFETWPEAGGPVTAVLLMGAVAAEAVVFRRDLKAGPITRSRLILYGVMGGLILIAGAAYLLGQTGRPLCDPLAAIQLHGVWHVASALAFGVFAETAFAPTSHIDTPAS
jgi:hypothetical protein